MIDTVYFENEYGEMLRPYEDFGIFMASHTIEEPKPKTYRVDLDGIDGDLDMSEWAGDVTFNTRKVTVAFRDMSAADHDHVVNFLLGQRVKIRFSEDPDFYYTGRCEIPTRTTQRRVTDFSFDFTCEPFKLRNFLTTQEVKRFANLRAERMSAQPTITASAACTATFGGREFALEAGEQTLRDFVITRRPTRLEVSDGATLTLVWRDGRL